LPGRFTARKLYGWIDRQYDQEYWGRLERNWRRWKSKRPKGRGIMKTIPKEEEIEEENESGQKKTTTRWATWLTYITSCRKIPQDEET